jgi:hypothetical protein
MRDAIFETEEPTTPQPDDGGEGGEGGDGGEEGGGEEAS